MTINIADVDTFSDPVQIPADLEDADSASIALFVQALANRTRNLKNRLDNPEFESIELEKPDTNAGAEIPALIHEMGQSATSRFWLWQSSTVGGVGARMRIYQDAQQNGGFCFTYNAAWDADTDQWVKDNTGVASTKYGIGASGGFTLQFVDAATAGPFDEASWNANILALGTDGTRTLLALAGWMASSVTPAANALYANNIVKAWASVTVASGVITVHDSFNIGTPSVVSTSHLRLPFRTNMANAQYPAVPGSSSALEFPRVSLRSTSAVDLQLVNSLTQAAVDLTANTRDFFVTVMGQQA